MDLAVIDASVAVKWFLDEAHTRAALALQSDFIEGRLTLRVPSHFPNKPRNPSRPLTYFVIRKLADPPRVFTRATLSSVPLLVAYSNQTLHLPFYVKLTFA